MSSSILKLRFLLDENVRKELLGFLQSRHIDVKRSPKAASDAHIAAISLLEKRILVTNDEDFTKYSKGVLFSVVWLRILQSDPQSLISSFAKLIEELDNFKDKLVILEKNKWKDLSLPVDVQLEP